MTAQRAGAAGLPPVEMWGGVECTCNRVGDLYFDQLEVSGHAERISDLDRFARLGIRALRYPVLWERATSGGSLSFRWSDERLGRLRELGMRPIVGLVHHGSGPRHATLLDPGFAEGLAAFARAVAERYPWVEDYTPVNEPGTTARFAALYGHWYPHARDARSFVQALLAECRATVLSMRAIREVVPAARLIQTEDLATTQSTEPLRYQAEHENERRLLAFDLLCGRVDRHHPLHGWLTASGASEAQLAWFGEHPSPPDIIGVNYYVTSDRLLDHRLERYPAHRHGGNGRDAYADVEAVRAEGFELGGHLDLLQRLWSRYQLPLAMTEVHLGCTREEQLRWLQEAWVAANQARATGLDVRAVTAWSLLGAFDWDCLVVARRRFYEPGAFDLRAPEPRPTAIATMIEALATGGGFEHPVLEVPGWWHRPERTGAPRRPTEASPSAARRPILITGARGMLGQAFVRVCEVRGLDHVLVTRQELDISDEQQARRLLAEVRPWAVVNAAGYVRVDDAERDALRCQRDNADGPAVLAELCATSGIQLLTFSSDLVFDGDCTRPYVETDTVRPLGVYGASKADAERAVLARMPQALVVRTSAFFGPWGWHDFVSAALHDMSRGFQVRAAGDTVVSPTYVPDLVHACLDALIDGAEGIWHLANRGEVTWADLARRAASLAGLSPELVQACEMRALALPAARPRYSALGSERAALLPPLEEALERHERERTRSLAV